MVTDPIADLLTRIRNASKASHSQTKVPYSKLKTSVLNVMKKHHFIDGFEVEKTGQFDEILIQLNPELKGLNLKRISKPGQRIHLKKDQLKKVLNGYGIGIISTSKGVMSAHEARKNGLGGELICEVW